MPSARTHSSHKGSVKALKIIVKSRNEARRDSFIVNDKKYAIISIFTPGDSPNVFAKTDSLKDTLFVSFHDIGCRDNSGIPISKDDAEQIAAFAKRVFNNNLDELWVHCDGGISRSAGVAAAIMKYFTGDDSEIFNSGRYIPNFTCYSMVLEALHNEDTR